MHSASWDFFQIARASCGGSASFSNLQTCKKKRHFSCTTSCGVLFFAWRYYYCTSSMYLVVNHRHNYYHPPVAGESLPSLVSPIIMVLLLVAVALLSRLHATAVNCTAPKIPGYKHKYLGFIQICKSFIFSGAQRCGGSFSAQVLETCMPQVASCGKHAPLGGCGSSRF